MQQEVLAFHYLAEGFAERVLRGGKSLQPSGPLIRYRGEEPHTFNSSARDLYTFCFLGSPKPTEWVKPSAFPQLFRGIDLWSLCMIGIFNNAGMVETLLSVLAIQLNSGDDVYVVDFSEHCKVTWGRYGIAGYPKITEAEGWENYQASRVPLKQYKNNFLVPELLIKSDVDATRVQKVGSTLLSSNHPPRFQWDRNEATRKFRSLHGL